MSITLVLGASENPTRTSHTAVKMLEQKGEKIIAVGNKKGTIGKIPIIEKIPEDIEVDTLTLYINPKIQKSMENEILGLKPKRIIFNPGTENPELEGKAISQGIKTISACTLVLLSTNQYYK